MRTRLRTTFLATTLLALSACGSPEGDNGIIGTNGLTDDSTTAQVDGADAGDGATPDTADPTETDTGTETDTDGGGDGSTTTDSTETDTYDPCAGLSCGDACSACPPDDADCIETGVIKACNEAGECVADTGDLCGEEPYDPCAGKACGDSCQLCAPDDLDCAETMEMKACNEAGECVVDTGDLCDETNACANSPLPADDFMSELPWSGGCGDVTLYAMPTDGTMEVVLWISGVCQEAYDSGGTLTRTYELPDAAVNLNLNIGSNVSDVTCDDVLEWENPMTVTHSIAASSGTVTLTATPDGEPQPWSVPSVVSVTLNDVVFTDATGCSSTVSSFTWTDVYVGWFPG